MRLALHDRAHCGIGIAHTYKAQHTVRHGTAPTPPTAATAPTAQRAPGSGRSSSALHLLIAPAPAPIHSNHTQQQPRAAQTRSGDFLVALSLGLVFFYPFALFSRAILALNHPLIARVFSLATGPPSIFHRPHYRWMRRDKTDSSEFGACVGGERTERTVGVSSLSAPPAGHPPLAHHHWPPHHTGTVALRGPVGHDPCLSATEEPPF